FFPFGPALSAWRGTFTFEADAPPPPGAYPLGSKWTLLAESSRRQDAAVLRARLGRKLGRRVLRSGGNAAGRIEELALNAQEARLWAAVDGTRTGEELLGTLPDPLIGVRLFHLLAELAHLSFEAGDEPQPK